MKSAEEIMEILNAYDLTGSLRDVHGRDKVPTGGQMRSPLVAM